MRPSKENKNKGRFSDVRFSRETSWKKLIGLFASRSVVNLKPHFYKRHPFRALVLAFAVIGLAFFAARQVFTKAEVADFYPSTCLGTWQNPASAQGEPETFSGASSTISDANSAVFSGATSSQVFCGGFVPQDFEAKGEIKNVGLTLVWQIGAVKEASGNGQEISAPEATSAALPAASSSAPAESSSTTSFWRWIPMVFAQTASETESTAPANDTTTVIIAPPITAAIVPLATSTAIATSTKAEDVSVATTTTITAPAPSTSSWNNSGSASGTKPEFVAAPAIPPPDENFLKLSYSTDGQTWIEIAKINQNNWQNFTVTLPIANWDLLKKLQIQIRGIPTTLNPTPKVYLDGMFAEVHYDLSPVLPSIIGGGGASEPGGNIGSASAPAGIPVIVLPPSQKPVPVQDKNTFRADESPQFNFDLNSLPAPAATTTAPSTNPSLLRINQPLAFLDFFLNFFRMSEFAWAQGGTPPDSEAPTAQNPIAAKIIDPAGNLTGFQPLIVVANNQLHISVPEPQSRFRPGRYKLKLWIWRDGVIYYTENDFTWGVLAVNFNKSIYTQGDKAKIGFAVLNDLGQTRCDAKIEMDVASPSGKTEHFSTTNKTIIKNLTCGPQTVTNEPDYSATMTTDAAGTYVVTVSATNENGARQITDKFEVQNPSLFDVERLAPTRIYPPATYQVTLKVKANADFAGQVTETVPNSWSVTTEEFGTRSFNGDAQTLSWQINMKKGDEKDFMYYFNAPNISPELYKLGPLQIGSWQEAREWQIAADAAGDIILLWDGASSTIPGGWTCVSCAASDPFFGSVFPRASSTYGTASSSANTVTHNASSSAVGGGASDSNVCGSGSSVPVSSHTHSISTFTTGSGDIRPPTLNVLFIKAATTTIPNGVIGMFDVSSSSLPTNWGWYSAMNANYLAGDVSTSSVGASTHSHTLSAVSTAAANTLATCTTNPNHTIAGAGHTHSISSSTPTAANTPPFINIVFAKSTATSTLGAGSGSNGLMAIFDNTALPVNWNIVSTSGSPYAGNLLKGSDTFGATGGTSTHTHTTSTITSTAPSGTATSKNGTGSNFASSGHTHSFSVTVDSQSSMPMYRDVILGKFTEPAGGTLSVSKVVLNSGSAITLTANTTTTISAVASTTAGANPILYATSTIYRSGVGATCAANNLNCYQLASSSCSFSGATTTVTCSADIWYFAQATDASSSFSSQNWLSQITITDSASATNSSTTASGVALNTLLAINVAPATISYGTLNPGVDSGSTNQTTTVKNAGNASTSLNVSGTALTLGLNNIATSSQHYATSTFTFGGGEQVLSGTATAVSGFLLTSPTSTNAVSSLTYWGVTVPNGSATGTYSGTNTFTAVFSQ